ncbi:MAG TPA: hypothetical protein VGG28_03720 [Kofleriaceae bacterium]|jgi:hypothetical protein
MIELGRSDIGFGSLIVDELGVTRRRLIRTQRIAWDDIREYRLGAKIQNATGELGRAFGGEFAMAIDFAQAIRGKRTPIRLSCELIGIEQHVMVNWRFAYVAAAIDEILRRIGPRLLDRARDELAREHTATFGDFALGAHGLRWRSRDLVEFAAVEKLALVDTTPVQLFVYTKQRAWPYAKLALDAVPNVLTLLALAKQLGYRVDGLELLQLTCS